MPLLAAGTHSHPPITASRRPGGRALRLRRISAPEGAWPGSGGTCRHPGCRLTAPYSGDARFAGLLAGVEVGIRRRVEPLHVHARVPARGPRLHSHREGAGRLLVTVQHMLQPQPDRAPGLGGRRVAAAGQTRPRRGETPDPCRECNPAAAGRSGSAPDPHRVAPGVVDLRKRSRSSSTSAGRGAPRLCCSTARPMASSK